MVAMIRFHESWNVLVALNYQPGKSFLAIQADLVTNAERLSADDSLANLV